MGHLNLIREKEQTQLECENILLDPIDLVLDKKIQREINLKIDQLLLIQLAK